MGWSLGWDSTWDRDIGYGVPAFCDHPGCNKQIDRGLSYVCGGSPYGGDDGCGLHFCGDHLFFTKDDEVELEAMAEHDPLVALMSGLAGPQVCERCRDGAEPFDPKPDHPIWMRHKVRHRSWKRWRAENPAEVERLRAELSVLGAITVSA